MSARFEPSPELTDCLKELRSILEQFIGLDDALIAVLVEHESAKHLRSEQTPIPSPVVQEIIQNRLHTAHMMVYSDSSEVLHGSLFSALHFFGATEPSGKPRTLQKLAEHIGRQHMVILFAANIAMCEVFESFHKKYGFSAAQAKADAIMKRLQTIAYLNQNEGGVSPKQEV
jgi:hypothetical protein